MTFDVSDFTNSYVSSSFVQENKNLRSKNIINNLGIKYYILIYIIGVFNNILGNILMPEV